MPEYIFINDQKIAPGESADVNLTIAKLPTYTSIDLPVRVIRAKTDGPVLMLTGGLHGDEINGIEIIRRMLYRELLTPEIGTVIALPIVNIYGFIQNVRGVPDGKDINRSFPGNKNGSLANQVAYTLMQEIIPQIDIGLDFHTGGASRSNFPQLRCTLDSDVNRDIARAFAPPVVLHSGLIDKSFRKAAAKKGKHILVYETGESLRLDEKGIQEGIDGTLRVMKYLGMKSRSLPAGKTEVYSKSSWIRARSAGLFQPRISLGDHIKKRHLLGKITDPFGFESIRIISRYEGRVIGLNHSPVVHKGDALMHVATNLTTL
ncbi:MAG: succinylglutamate desuccinylase/aspartoacylase family protein [Balneolaceae bacterium]